MSDLITISTEADQSIIKLLNQYVVGTPGRSMVYQHQNILDKLKSIPDPLFIKLCHRDQLVGTLCLSKRRAINGGKQHLAYYLRYFMFNEKFRTGKTEKTSNRKKNSRIRDEVALLWEGKGLDIKESFFFYAFVDPENVRSLKIIHDFGFKKISSFSVLIYSRMFPGNDSNLIKCRNEELDDIRKRLLSYYRNEHLLFFDHLKTIGNYFEYRVSGKVVCGAHVIPEEWLIKDLPGIAGKIILHLVPYIPFLNRLFRKNFRFLLIEGIYIQKGYERYFQKLLSAILYRYRRHVAIMSVDPESKVFGLIKKINLGIIHAIRKEIKMDVVIKKVNSENDGPQSPVYISGMDIL